MSQSAFFGQPPNTQRDLNIVRGIYRSSGVNASLIDPRNGAFFAATAPPGYVHENKQTDIIAGMSLVILIMAVTTAARLLVKMRGQATRFDMDDWVMIPAACLAITFPALQIYIVVGTGGGRHSWENTYEDYNKFAWMLETCTVIFYAAVALIKLSVTLFVRRLAAAVSRRCRLLVDVFMATVIMDLVAAVLWNVLLCNPTSAFWNAELAGSLPTPAKCGNPVQMTKALSTIHTVQGVLLLTTPVVILWQVPMDAAKKLRLFILWWFGAITVVGGLLQQFIVSQGSGDIFYEYTATMAWTTLDLSMGIVTASLPTLDSAIVDGWKAARSKVSGLGDAPTDLESGGGSTEFILADRGDFLEMHIVRESKR